MHGVRAILGFHVLLFGDGVGVIRVRILVGQPKQRRKGLKLVVPWCPRDCGHFRGTVDVHNLCCCLVNYLDFHQLVGSFFILWTLWGACYPAAK